MRNLVGIAGKPHPSTVLAAIGPQTAKTCEEHGLRVDVVARRNVARVVETIVSESETLRDLVRDGRIAVVGAMYDVATGNIEFLSDDRA